MAEMVAALPFAAVVCKGDHWILMGGQRVPDKVSTVFPRSKEGEIWRLAMSGPYRGALYQFPDRWIERSQIESGYIAEPGLLRRGNNWVFAEPLPTDKTRILTWKIDVF